MCNADPSTVLNCRSPRQSQSAQSASTAADFALLTAQPYELLDVMPELAGNTPAALHRLSCAAPSSADVTSPMRVPHLFAAASDGSAKGVTYGGHDLMMPCASSDVSCDTLDLQQHSILFRSGGGGDFGGGSFGGADLFGANTRAETPCSPYTPPAGLPAAADAGLVTAAAAAAPLPLQSTAPVAGAAKLRKRKAGPLARRRQRGEQHAAVVGQLRLKR